MKKYLLAAVAIVGCAVGVMHGSEWLLERYNSRPIEISYTYNVHQDDTLWEVASVYAKAEKVDMQEVLYYLQLDNRLRGKYIYPGQELKINIRSDK